MATSENTEAQAPAQQNEYSDSLPEKMEKKYVTVDGKQLQLVENRDFGGERALFATHNLDFRHCAFHAGESALKCCSNIHASDCLFEGKYPFWHVDGFVLDRCEFTPGARAALWYSRDLVMRDCVQNAPKMFREMDNLLIENVDMPDALETFWSCRGVKLRNVKVEKADYLFMHSSDIDIENYHQLGNYSFQYCKNVVIRNAYIDSRDAFWETDNVTIYDSKIEGEFLGWHSRNLKFVRCHINGIQPLCYCENLVLEDCTMGDDCYLAFEDSTFRATVDSNIVSVKNPRSGSLKALSIGEVIIDKNVLAPNDCKIETEI